MIEGLIIAPAIAIWSYRATIGVHGLNLAPTGAVTLSMLVFACYAVSILIFTVFPALIIIGSLFA